MMETTKDYVNLEYQELEVPQSISARTLTDMNHAISNFKRDDISKVIDLSDFKKADCFTLK